MGPFENSSLQQIGESPGQYSEINGNLKNTGDSNNKYVLATAALALGAASASAADLAARPYTKAPAAPVAVGYNWSGFYAGVMGGYSWWDRIRVDGFTAASSDINGGFGGGTIGYNWQTPGSNFVWGLEVDAAGGDVKYRETGLFGIAGYRGR